MNRGERLFMGMIRLLRRGNIFWVISTLFFISGFWLFAQEGSQKKNVERIEPKLHYDIRVVLKLVQVSVVDKKGNLVTDLTRDDFVVYDNGRLVRLTEFENHIFREDVRAQKIDNDALPPSVGSISPGVKSSLNRKFLFLFDFAFNNLWGIGQAKKAALYFLENRVNPEDEVAVITFSMFSGLRVLEFLTRDHGQAKLAIEKIDQKSIAGRANDIEQAYWGQAGESPPPVGDHGIPQPDVSKNYNWERQESKRLSQVYISRLTDLAKALRYVPGQKNVLFFSRGLPASIIYGTQSGNPQTLASRTRYDSGDSLLKEQNEEMMKEFSASGCVFYTFDTREASKEESLFAYDDRTFESGYRDIFSGLGVFQDSTDVFRDEKTTGLNFLQRLSQQTSGKFYGNIRFYEKNAGDVNKITGSFYVLGYPVEEREDGRFHEVRVEVKRKGCQAIGTSGYFNPKPFAEFSTLEKKLHLFDLALNERALSRVPSDFPMTVLPLACFDKTTLLVLARIRREMLENLQPGPSELILLIFDDQGDIVLMPKAELRPLSAAGGNRENDLVLASQVMVKPGKYDCRLIIRNLRTGSAAVSSVFRVNAFATGASFGVLPPMLLTEATSSKITAIENKVTEAYKWENLYLPRSVEHFSPAVGKLIPQDRVIAVVPCYWPKDEDQELAAGVHIINSASGNEIMKAANLREVSASGLFTVLIFDLDVQKLMPGNYVIYVNVQNQKTNQVSYSRTLFQVEAGEK